MPPTVRQKAVQTKAIRLEAFDIHGHNGDQPFDYKTFFDFIASLQSVRRREQVADKIIAVPNFYQTNSIYQFAAYVGSSDSSFLVLDLENGSEEVRQLESGKLLATRTVGIIDPARRIAIVQYVHFGVRAQQIATLFEKLAHLESPQFAGATLEFAARPGEEFRRQLLELERIQSVSLTLTKPNNDWLDYAKGLTELANDSDAHNIAVSASASRSQSLSKTGGVVSLLRELASGTRRSILKAASVHGSKAGQDDLITLHLNKLTQAKTSKVESVAGAADQIAIANAAKDFLGSMNGEQ